MSRLPLTLATANKVVEEEELIVKDFCFSSCCHQGTRDGFDMTMAGLLDLTCQVLFSQMYLFYVQSCFFKCWLQNILRCSLIAKVRLDREICVPAQQLKGFLDARLCLFCPDVYFSQLRWGRASCLKKINELTHWHELLSALLPNPFCYPLCIQERAVVSVAEKSMAEKCSNIWDPTQTHAYKKKPPRPRKTLIA